MDLLRQYFRRVWAVDFEFGAPPGGRPEPRCVVARELFSGKLVRLWLDGGRVPERPPYDTGPDSFFVAYYASAELGCHLALDWPIPVRIVDLYAEFRCLTSGLPVVCGYGLLGALTYFGLPAMDSAEKAVMRDLALRGGPYTDAERRDLLDYCQADVDALGRLLPAMLPTLDLPRALLRGRYMAAAARMEWVGVPIDVEALDRLRANWEGVKGGLINAVDPAGEVYTTARPRSFSAARFAGYLARHGIAWPRLPSGALALDDETFREQARAHPRHIGPLRELRHALGQMRVSDLAVGPDGRNRCLLSAFGSRTGRNQPSNARFIFGPSVWLRPLIQPGPGRAVAYVDWSQQELAIAAALSGDPAMREAYRSGDFYLTFAKMAGAAPPHATKMSHGAIREQFKSMALGVLFGLSAWGLAHKLDMAPCYGKALLDHHQQTFRRFWAWARSVVDQALLTNRIDTCFGWTLHVGPKVTTRTLSNFPMQAHGAEMMRIAACLATERGVTVCAPVHDAFLIEADADAIDVEIARMQAAMREASELVLPGFPLRSDAKIVRHPDRYSDPRGERFWCVVQSLLAQLDGSDTPALEGRGTPSLQGTPVQSYFLSSWISL
jgi:hypothetical protein